MRCRCGGDTQVTDSRVIEEGMRRRRHCTSCNRRFTTYETTAKPANHAARRDYKKRYDAERYAAQTDEQKLRAKMRREARRVAMETGRRPEALYKEWNCA